MRRIRIVILIAIIMNTQILKVSAEQPTYSKAIIVEDNYLSSNRYRIVQSKNGYEKITIHGKERYKQLVQSTKEILKLPINLDTYESNEIFLLPSVVEEIIFDIPYNYFSSLESSAKYFQLLLRDSWEIEYYNASSLCIQVGLIKDGITCRLLIYEDYLKVYCRLI